MNEVKEISMEVFEVLGQGYNETVYQSAMLVEFRKRNIRYSSEVIVPIMYKETYIGYGRADIILPDLGIIIELKSVANLSKLKVNNQIRAYMKALDVPLGLVVNFPQSENAVCEFIDVT